MTGPKDDLRIPVTAQLETQKPGKGLAKNIYTIYLSEEEGKSVFTAGQKREIFEHSKGFPIIYHDLVTTDRFSDFIQHWMIRYSFAKLGEQHLNSKATHVVFDTGCTLHTARKPFIDDIVAKAGLEDCHRYGEGKSALICGCKKSDFEALPSLKLELPTKGSISLDRDQWVDFAPEHNKCAILFQELPESWSEDILVFGLRFFRKYFTVFDTNWKRIGLVPYKEIKSTALKKITHTKKKKSGKKH